MDEELLALSHRVKEMRIERKITQKQLANVLGVTQTHLSNLENGRVKFSLELLLKISKIFGCTMVDLFSADNQSAVLTTENGMKITAAELGEIVVEVINQIDAKKASSKLLLKK